MNEATIRKANFLTLLEVAEPKSKDIPAIVGALRNTQKHICGIAIEHGLLVDGSFEDCHLRCDWYGDPGWWHNGVTGAQAEAAVRAGYIDLLEKVAGAGKVKKVTPLWIEIPGLSLVQVIAEVKQREIVLLLLTPTHGPSRCEHPGKPEILDK